jgi:hypothetical protein
MTSFTRKLYNRDPAAALAFQRAHEFERQLVYGKAPTLACFTPSSNGLRPAFGKRAVKPRHVPCPHQQTFCVRNGLSQHDCPICKNWKG